MDERQADPTATLLARGVLAVVHDGLLPVAVVRAGRIQQASPGLERMFALEPGAGQGRSLLELVSEPHRAKVGLWLRAATSGRLALAFEGLRADGRLFQAELVGLSTELDGAPASVLIVTDVTARRRSEAQLSALAFADPLTGLPNRALLLDRLQQILAESRRVERRFAILAIDLDGFKLVNDRFGHEAGDVVLRTVARRFSACVRDADTVARVGGDELTVLLGRIGKREDAAIVAGRMLRTLQEPITVPGGTCTVGASIGIVSHPEDGCDFDQLLAGADAAMYESKRGGKNRFTFSASSGTFPAARQPPFLYLSAAHVLGNTVIDEQHAEIVERANRLGDVLKAGLGPTEQLSALSALLSFTEAHFAAEEALMDGLPPEPSFTRHRQLHRALLEDLRSLSAQVDDRSMTLTMRYLHDWLFHHVDTMDRLLTSALARAAGDPDHRAA